MTFLRGSFHFGGRCGSSLLCGSALRLALAAGLVLGLTVCRRAGPRVPESAFASLGVHRVASVSPDCVEPTDFVFSPDGRRVIYAGELRNSAGPQVGVWLNDTLLMRMDSVFELGFNEAGISYFVGKDSGKAFIYYRFARPRAYDVVTAPTFTRDGKYYAYLASNGGRQSLLVANGITRSFFDVNSYALCPVGEQVAYASRDSVDWFVVTDYDTSDIYDEVGSMTYSRDGAHIAYAAEVYGNWLVAVDGEELLPYPDEVLEISEVTLSDNGEHLAYIVTEEDTATERIFQYPVIDEEEADAHSDVTNLCFSPDGTKLARIVSDGGGQFVIDDYWEERPYDEVWGPVYSPDNQRLAYVAREGNEEFVVMSGDERGAHESIDKVSFSASGNRIGFGALDGQQFSWVVESVD